MASCSACVFPRYPAEYSDARRAAAIPVFVVSMLITIVGLVLFTLRRQERLVTKRNYWLTVLISANSFICMYVPYREYYGEGSFPCVLQFLFPNILFAMVPSGLIVRYFGLYAQHIRQRMVHELTGLSTDSATSELSELDCEDRRTDTRLLEAPLLVTRNCNDVTDVIRCTQEFNEVARAVRAAPAADKDATSETPRLPLPSDATVGLPSAQPRTTDETGSPQHVLFGDITSSVNAPSPQPGADASPAAGTADPRKQHASSSTSAVAIMSSISRIAIALKRLVGHCTDSFYRRLDAWVLYLQLHTARSGVLFMAVLCTPRLVYYLARIATVPEYRTWDYVGCRLDYTDMASFVVITAPFFFLTLPLLAHLRAKHDALWIRYELGIQLAAFPPFVVWYFYGKFTDADIFDQNGDYSSLAIMIVISLFSLWAPAILSYRFVDMQTPSKSKIVPLESERLRTSTRLNELIASTAGQRILDELRASGLLENLPSLPDVLRILEPPHRYILQRPAHLSIVAALLIGTSWGFKTMKNLAAQELAGEPLGFIRASMAVRTLAKSTTNSDAVVLRAQKIPVQRVPPFVLREVKALDDAPRLLGHSVAPEAALACTASTTPRLPPVVQIVSPALSPGAVAQSAPTDLSVYTELLPSPTMTETRVNRNAANGAPPEASSTPAHRVSLEGVSTHLHRLMGRYVLENATLQVNLSPSLVQNLQDAEENVRNAAAPDAPPIKRIFAVESLDAALCAAEHELFESLTRGPVFRFVQKRKEFAAWADQARTVLTGTSLTSKAIL